MAFQGDLFGDDRPRFVPGRRTFYEVDGGRAGLPSGQYVEMENARSRTAPSPHHIFVGTRTSWPSLVQHAGWLDLREVNLRELKAPKDQATIDAILRAEKRADERAASIYQVQKAIHDTLKDEG